MKKYFIYGLFDPNTKELMYIGQTSNLGERMKSHMKSSNRNKSKLCTWLKSLNCNKPIMKIIEICDDRKLLNDAEIFWIDILKPSKNTAKGGCHSNINNEIETKYDYDYNKISEMINKGCTIKNISDMIGCYPGTVRKYLAKVGLKTKNSAYCRPDGSFISIPSRQVISKEEMIELYVTKQMTCPEIAKIKKCSSVAIKTWLRKYGIPRRTPSETLHIKYAKGWQAGFRKNPIRKS